LPTAPARPFDDSVASRSRDLNAAIGASAIDHDYLGVTPFLRRARTKRFQRGADRAFLVEHRHDYGEFQFRADGA
jgi:hypothetical protein